MPLGDYRALRDAHYWWAFSVDQTRKYIRFWKGGVPTDLPIQIRDYRVFINFLDFVFLSFTVEKLGS